MSTQLLAEKVIAQLPETLQPNTMYFVRVGAGYDSYVTDETGAVAFTQNQRADASECLMAGNGFTVSSNWLRSITGHGLKPVYLGRVPSGIGSIYVTASGTHADKSLKIDFEKGLVSDPQAGSADATVTLQAWSGSLSQLESLHFTVVDAHYSDVFATYRRDANSDVSGIDELTYAVVGNLRDKVFSRPENVSIPTLNGNNAVSVTANNNSGLLVVKDYELFPLGSTITSAVDILATSIDLNVSENNDYAKINWSCYGQIQSLHYPHSLGYFSYQYWDGSSWQLLDGGGYIRATYGVTHSLGSTEISRPLKLTPNMRFDDNGTIKWRIAMFARVYSGYAGQTLSFFNNKLSVQHLRSI